MSTETSPTGSVDPTEPVAAAPKTGTVKPNNQYQDIIATDVTADATTAGATAKATKKTTVKPGGVLPDNQYQDGAPKG